MRPTSVSEATHITDRRDNSVKSNEIDATKPGQSQQRFLGHDLLGHVPAQQSATRSRRHQAAVQLLQQHRSRRRPCPQGKQSPNGVRMAQPKALFQTHTMFVQHRAQLLLGPSRFLHHRLIRTEHLAPLRVFGSGCHTMGESALK